jgi:hypothetical protein
MFLIKAKRMRTSILWPFFIEKIISIRQKRTKSSKGFLGIHREFLSMMPFYVVGGDSVDQRNLYALSRPDP